MAWRPRRAATPTVLERAIADARMVALASICDKEALIPGQYTYYGRDSMRCEARAAKSKDENLLLKETELEVDQGKEELLVERKLSQEHVSLANCKYTNSPWKRDAPKPTCWQSIDSLVKSSGQS